MRRAALLLALLAFLALGAAGLAGCGGGEEGTATPETIEGELPEPATTEEGEAPDVEGDAQAGEAVFASSGCGSCHTLGAAGATGNVGPNLDETAPNFDTAFQTIKNGRGGMPAFDGQLEEQQIADVAQYVAESVG